MPPPKPIGAEPEEAAEGSTRRVAVDPVLMGMSRARPTPPPPSPPAGDRPPSVRELLGDIDSTRPYQAGSIQALLDAGRPSAPGTVDTKEVPAVTQAELEEASRRDSPPPKAAGLVAWGDDDAERTSKLPSLDESSAEILVERRPEEGAAAASGAEAEAGETERASPAPVEPLPHEASDEVVTDLVVIPPEIRDRPRGADGAAPVGPPRAPAAPSPDGAPPAPPAPPVAPVASSAAGPARPSSSEAPSGESAEATGRTPRRIRISLAGVVLVAALALAAGAAIGGAVMLYAFGGSVSTRVSLEPTAVAPEPIAATEPLPPQTLTFQPPGAATGQPTAPAAQPMAPGPAAQPRPAPPSGPPTAPATEPVPATPSPPAAPATPTAASAPSAPEVAPPRRGEELPDRLVLPISFEAGHLTPTVADDEALEALAAAMMERPRMRFEVVAFPAVGERATVEGLETLSRRRARVTVELLRGLGPSGRRFTSRAAGPDETPPRGAALPAAVLVVVRR